MKSLTDAQLWLWSKLHYLRAIDVQGQYRFSIAVLFTLSDVMFMLVICKLI